jgi:hypothetical protein
MYWLKQIGDNDPAFYAGRLFHAVVMRIDFGRRKRPSGIRVGDTLVVYGIGIKQILYVASAITKPYPPSRQDLAAGHWRNRWYWSINGTNLSPTFGLNWSVHHLDPYELVASYHQMHPNARITANGNKSLSGLRYGPGYLRLDDAFGEFVVQTVLALNH